MYSQRATLRTLSVALLGASIAFDSFFALAQQPPPPPTAEQLAADREAILREADLNLPGPGCKGSACPAFPIRWAYSPSGIVPWISIKDARGLWLDQAGAYYLGWNDEGSWFVNGTADPRSSGNKHVYVWKLTTNSLTDRYASEREIPQEVLLSLKNFRGNYLLATKDHRRPEAAVAPKPLPPGKHNVPDPNLLDSMSLFSSELAVRWARMAPTMNGPPVREAVRQYLGWNDEGSWMMGEDGKVYVWNFHRLRLAKYFESVEEIPAEVRATLNQAN